MTETVTEGPFDIGAHYARPALARLGSSRLLDASGVIAGFLGEAFQIIADAAGTKSADATIRFVYSIIGDMDAIAKAPVNLHTPSSPHRGEGDREAVEGYLPASSPPIQWHRLGDVLPQPGEPILLAIKYEEDAFWRVRDAAMRCRHEDVVPKISDMDGGQLQYEWYFGPIYGRDDTRLPLPDYMWAKMPTPKHPRPREEA